MERTLPNSAVALPACQSPIRVVLLRARWSRGAAVVAAEARTALTTLAACAASRHVSDALPNSAANARVEFIDVISIEVVLCLRLLPLSPQEKVGQSVEPRLMSLASWRCEDNLSARRDDHERFPVQPGRVGVVISDDSDSLDSYALCFQHILTSGAGILL